MSDFAPGDNGFVDAWLIGGPLDGIAYNDMPVMPDGEPALRVSVPLPESDEHAVYDRRPHIWLDGRWYYDFVEITSDPNPVQPAGLPTGTVVDGAIGGRQADEQQFFPAPRFVKAQAWWIASELARRHSRFRVLESWPMNGIYTGFEVGEIGDSCRVFLNFEGRIHMLGDDAASEPIPWSMTLAAESPHETVKSIEEAMHWNTTGAEPTNAGVLVYRVASAFVTQRLNDKHRWDVVSCHSANVARQDAHDSLALLDSFPGALRLAESDLGEQTIDRFWMFTAGRAVALVMHDSGMLFQRGKDPIDLMSIYTRRRRLTDVLIVVSDAAEDAHVSD